MQFDSDLKDMHFLTVVVKEFDLPPAYGCIGRPEVITRVNYGNRLAECLFNPNFILFIDYDRLSHLGT